MTDNYKWALRVGVDGTLEVVAFTNETALKVLQGCVGGLIQPLEIVIEGDDGCTIEVELTVNEEGKIYRLPYNAKASAMFDAAYGENIDVILGDAVITGPPDHNGYTKGLTLRDIDDIIEFFEEA